MNTGIYLFSIAALSLISVAAPQSADAQSSGEIVQPLPTQAEGNLRAALLRLANDPGNLDALRSAGFAALDLGDTDAAQDFFARAQASSRSDARILMGLAVIAVREEDPYQSLALFDRAEAGGADLGVYSGDRGLAYDLVGDLQRAQRSYRAALAERDDPIIARRLALSHAMSGDMAAAEGVLLPLLQGEDRAAFRTRAFALAIVSRYDEAMAIVQALQSPAAAAQLAPYLRQLPELSSSQQAAAANFGHFPRNLAVAGPVSRPRSRAELPAAAPSPRSSPQADSRLEPQGEPLGTISTPTPEITPEAASVPALVVSREPDADAAAVLPETQPAIPTMQQIDRAEAPARPAIDVVTAESSPVAPVVIDPTPATPAPQVPVTMDDAFSSFRLPSDDVAPSVGAVDIRTIEPTRETPPVAVQSVPAAPAHPARHWVQVATGRDRAALRFDWRRIKRAGGDLLSGRDGFVASWGETNRLVTGPFASAADADTMVSNLRAQDVDSFRFRSAGDEVVDPLP